MNTMMDAQRKSNFIKEAVVASVEAPKLNGISFSQLTDCKRLRNLYEKQIEKIYKQLKENLIPIWYSASIEDDVLRISTASGWGDSSSIDELAEKENTAVFKRQKKERECVGTTILCISGSKKLKHKDAPFWSRRQELHTQKGVLHCHTNRGVWRYCRRQTTYHHKWHTYEVESATSISYDDGYHQLAEGQKLPQKTFDRFIREVARQVERIRTKERLVPTFAQSRRGEGSRTPRTIYHTKYVHNAIKHRKGHSVNAISPQRLQADMIKNDKKENTRKREVFEATFCLNPKCREQRRRYYLSKCGIWNKKTSDLSLEQYRKNKKARYHEQEHAGNIGRIINVTTSTHSSIFKTTFAKWTIEFSC